MNWISVRYAEDYRKHIQVFLLDLYLTHSEDSERYIGFSRNSGRLQPVRLLQQQGVRGFRQTTPADHGELRRQGQCPEGFALSSSQRQEPPASQGDQINQSGTPTPRNGCFPKKAPAHWSLFLHRGRHRPPVPCKPGSYVKKLSSWTPNMVTLKRGL